jgi:release factor glutamine methyltransferase
MTLDQSQERRNEELRQAVSQSRDIEIEGLRLHVFADVFPPDLGYSSLLMARSLASMKLGESALDVGAGSLFLALTMRRLGVPRVCAIDKSEQAIRCAALNLERNSDLAPIDIRRSDLFSALRAHEKFDTIVFNQPFYPILGREIAGMGADGGKEIIARFLKEAPAHLRAGGFVLMSDSTIAAEEDSASRVAGALGWRVEECGAVENGGVRSRVVRLR